MSGSQPPDQDLAQALGAYAASQDLDLVEYFDDGEWHVQLVGGSDLVADGYGGNPSEARESLARHLGLSS